MGKVICWDFDGTLAYSNSLWSNAVYKAIKETQTTTNITLDNIKKHMSEGFTWHTPNEDYHKLIGDMWWDFMNKRFSDIYIILKTDKATADKASKKVRGIVKKSHNYTLYEDTITTLKYCKQKGYINVLLSNNYPDLNDVLDELDISKYFEHFVISALVGYDKPRNEIFEYARKLYKNACKYYMVGDNISADIIGAKNTGMTTILIHNTLESTADYSFKTLAEVCAVL